MKISRNRLATPIEVLDAAKDAYVLVHNEVVDINEYEDSYYNYLDEHFSTNYPASTIAIYADAIEEWEEGYIGAEGHWETLEQALNEAV